MTGREETLRALAAEARRLEALKAELEDDIETTEARIATTRSRAGAEVEGRVRRRLSVHRAVILALALAPLAALAAAGASPASIPRTHLRGRVVDAHGAAPAEIGEFCRGDLRPVRHAYNGHLKLECGGQRLYGYGRFGFLRCRGRGPWLLCEDRDTIAEGGDPQVLLRRADGLLRLQDEAWGIDIRLD